MEPSPRGPCPATECRSCRFRTARRGRAPTHAVDELFAGLDEAYLSWDLGSYDDVTEYEVSVDGRCLGGIYDEVLYVEELGQQAGTLELRAVAHDRTRSAPATVPSDLSAAPSGLTATAAGAAAPGPDSGGVDLRAAREHGERDHRGPHRLRGQRGDDGAP